MIEQVKTWYAAGNGKLLAVNPFNYHIVYNVDDKEDCEKASQIRQRYMKFEDWRNDPANQPSCDESLKGEYGAEMFEEAIKQHSWLGRWIHLDELQISVYQDQALISRLFLPLKEVKPQRNKVVELPKDEKPVKARPSLYAIYFELLKPIAKDFGYNLLLHGSLDRDIDIVAVPWVDEPKDECIMLQEFDKCINGICRVAPDGGSLADAYHFSVLPGGRKSYFINVNRGGNWNGYDDRQYYIDISVTPLIINP